MDISPLLRAADEAIEKIVQHLLNELGSLQIGRAHAGLVENIQVESYGSYQPLRNIASVMVPDPKTIFIEPWDKGNLRIIEKGIQESRLGLNPNNDGQRIFINIPPLTEERRKELTRIVGQFAEEAKISIRRSREDLRKKAKHSVENSELTEDDEKIFDKKLQEKVDTANSKIDEAAKKKEGEMLKI